MVNLSLCIITKDNESTINDCLSSVSGLVNEIVVVDTGSKDNTKDLVSKFTNKIYDFVWNNNFSEAKNFALDRVKGDWVLALDADETLSKSDHKRILEAINNAPQGVFGFSLIQRNYTNNVGSFSFVSSKDDPYSESKVSTGFVPRRIIRLFKNHPKIRFEGVVHDTPEKSIRKFWKVAETSIPIHHYGMLSRDNVERTEMYVDIEKKNLKEDDYLQHYKIASQLHSLNKFDEALDYLKKSLEINKDFYLSYLEKGIILIKKGNLDLAKESLDVAYNFLLKEISDDLHKSHLAMVLEHQGIIAAKEKLFEKATELFSKAIFLAPKNADLYFNLGLVSHNSGHKTRASLAFKKAVELNPSYKELINIDEEQ